MESNNTVIVPPVSVSEVESAMKSIEESVDTGRPPEPVAVARSPFALKEFVDVEQLKLDVTINPNDLDDAVLSHAAKFVHYANQSRLARRQWEKMKNAFDILESRLYQVHRELLTAGEAKKPTEAVIDAAVKTDPRWWAASNRLTDAQAIYNLANDARSAFEQRRDMIIQISTDRREERKGQLRIMEAKGDADSVAAARARAIAAVANSK
jgi:hypothetical protein